TRSVDGLDGDRALRADGRLAFAQAGVERPGALLPADAAQVRKLLPEGFVREFIEHLAMLDVDVVRLDGLSTAYSFTVEGRPVILLPESGNWFYENWSLAHELGHLALGHEGVIAGATGSDAGERAANAFAAELLLPAATMRQIAWDRINVSAVAELVWEWGTSTGAVRHRL